MYISVKDPRAQAKHMRDLLLAVGMEVNSINSPSDLVEAYIIEALETRAADFTDTVIWYQEFLFPTHEHIFTIRAVLVVKVGLFRLFCQGPPSREACPVLHVFFVAGSPVIVTGLECVLGADYLAFKESCKSCVFGSEPCG